MIGATAVVLADIREAITAGAGAPTDKWAAPWRTGRPATSDPPPGLLADWFATIRARADGPTIRIRPGTRAASYNVRSDIVRVPGWQDCTSAGAWWWAVAHELAHATGHPDRLGRPFGRWPRASGPDAARRHEEVVAEIGAAVILRRGGIDRTWQHAQFVRSFADGVDLWRAAADAAAAVAWLFPKPDILSG